MIFKRRIAPSSLTRLRDLLRPRKGWRRGFRYIGRRMQRLPDTPHRIALGFACGVQASFTPFFTLHVVVALALALVLRGNLVASALGTLFGNPLTFPFIAGSALTLGQWLLGDTNPAVAAAAEDFDAALVFRDVRRFLDKYFLPYLVGGILPGLLTGGLCYWLLRPAVAAYQDRRRNQLIESARRRVQAGLSRVPVKTNPLPEGID